MDGTRAVLRQFGVHVMDGRRGLSAARNLGVTAASGAFALSDASDEWVPGKFLFQITYPRALPEAPVPSAG